MQDGRDSGAEQSDSRLTTSNFDTTVSTQVGLPVKSFDQLLQRINNLPNIPDGLMLTKEANILVAWIAKSNLRSSDFTTLKSQVEYEVRARKRL